MGVVTGINDHLKAEMSKKYSRKYKNHQIIIDEEITFERFEHRQIEPINGITKNQVKYLFSIKENQITFGIGCAGTGKSYVAAGFASDMLRNKKIQKIVVTRPMAECDEEPGILPGELAEKYAPYFQPFKDILIDRLGKSATEYYMKRGQIEARPLAYMRGSTFTNSIVVLDEAQNTTINQMKMFLTRVGDNTKLLVNGDIEQIDISKPSGLVDAVRRLKSVPRVGIVAFDESDIVRSKICKDIILAYRR